MFVCTGMKQMIFIAAFILCSSSFAVGQDRTYYSAGDLQDISAYLEDARNTWADEAKRSANQKALDDFRELLEDPASFSYNYDSLKYIHILESDDGKLRIFTWNLMFNDMTHRFYGFIQHMPDEDTYHVHELKDKTDFSTDSRARYHYHTEWYGAVYYDIIEKKDGRKTLYTLLGWKGQDDLVQQKVIETLEFGRKDLPQFGDNNFRIDRDREDRIVFRYSTKAQMQLYHNTRQDMIVFDHLSPGNPKMIGHWEYYGPDFSYDAFEYKNGIWYFVSDIDPDIAINYEENEKIKKLKQRKPSKKF